MILFAEVPGFYAELERAADPSLAERPVLVGGDPRKKGTVQSATPDALAQGVELGMPVLDALSACPGARALRTNMKVYREVGSRLRACFRRVADRVEPVGEGAAFLDSDAAAGVDLEELARGLQAEVRATLRLPLRVGIAPVKFVARLAAEEAGPEGVCRVVAHELRSFLGPLPVARLPGVGARTEATLHELGARTVDELAGLEPGLVEEGLGNHGLQVLSLARGQGETRVRAGTHRRSLSQEVTLEAGEVDLGVLREQLQELSARLEQALLREHLAARRVILKLRYEDQETITRSRTLEHPIQGAQEFLAVAIELLSRTQAGSRPVRLVGMALTELRRAPRDDRQLTLFDA